jgi:Ca-activated chloride channel family protein
MNQDPRITAYITGELQGCEREKFEAELAASDNLDKEVVAMFRLAAQLAAAPKPVDGFTAPERAALIAKCVKNHKAQRSILRRMNIVILAAAACILLLAWPAFQSVMEGDFFAQGPWSGIDYGSVHEQQARRAQAVAGSAPADDSSSYNERSIDPSPQELLSSQAVANLGEIQPVTVASAAVIGGMDPYEDVASAPQMLAMPALSAPKATPPPMAAERPPSAGYVRRAVLAALPDSGVSHGRQTAVTPPNEFNTEAYAPVRENEFVTAKDNPLSTFSIDVDTASYSNVRRFLNDEVRPPTGAIRTEELINYFRYNYPQPTGEDPFSVNLEVSRAPWNPEHELVRIGLKGRELPAEDRGPANLVFLIDVSGSMDEPNKLPLLQRSLAALVENLSDEDRVAMVTYAGSSGLVLPPTPGTKKREILNAIANLRAEGSTHGSEGIRSAYETARQNFRKDGSNRVILCTDGDFNVGVTSESELQKLIEKERESGVFLSVLGFGTGNLKDSTMELLANKGNGNYAYIDSISEGRKVLVEQMGSTLFTIAKDVKIQLEFNPARVAGYRLIGYENRLLAREDFNDDTKDAGEIGAGHTVTALYEIIPAGQPVPGSPSIDPLKYQQPEQDSGTVSDELLTVKLRYKAPDGDRSKLIEIPLAAGDIPPFAAASEDFRFAAAVAAFGMKLRGSPDAGEISWSEIQNIVRGALGSDPGSYRAEFLTLIEKVKAINEQKGNE